MKKILLALALTLLPGLALAQSCNGQFKPYYVCGRLGTAGIPTQVPGSITINGTQCLIGSTCSIQGGSGVAYNFQAQYPIGLNWDGQNNVTYYLDTAGASPGWALVVDASGKPAWKALGSGLPTAAFGVLTVKSAEQPLAAPEWLGGHVDEVLVRSHRDRYPGTSGYPHIDWVGANQPAVLVYGYDPIVTKDWWVDWANTNQGGVLVQGGDYPANIDPNIAERAPRFTNNRRGSVLIAYGPQAEPHFDNVFSALTQNMQNGSNQDNVYTTAAVGRVPTIVSGSPTWAVEWRDPATGLPPGGTAGQVLTQTASGPAWQEPSSPAPITRPQGWFSAAGSVPSVDGTGASSMYGTGTFYYVTIFGDGSIPIQGSSGTITMHRAAWISYYAPTLDITNMHLPQGAMFDVFAYETSPGVAQFCAVQWTNATTRAVNVGWEGTGTLIWNTAAIPSCIISGSTNTTAVAVNAGTYLASFYTNTKNNQNYGTLTNGGENSADFPTNNIFAMCLCFYNQWNQQPMFATKRGGGSDTSVAVSATQQWVSFGPSINYMSVGVVRGFSGAKDKSDLEYSGWVTTVGSTARVTAFAAVGTPGSLPGVNNSSYRNNTVALVSDTTGTIYYPVSGQGLSNTPQGYSEATLAFSFDKMTSGQTARVLGDQTQVGGGGANMTLYGQPYLTVRRMQ